MIVLCGINSAIQLYFFPARPTDCGRGEGETVSEGGKVNLFRDRRIHSDALDAITTLTSPQSISIDFLILPFLKLLIGIVAHIAILHLCLPILANFYEKNLYLKSVAGITKRKMKEILSIPDKEEQCNLLLSIRCISCQSKNNWCGH